MFASLGHRSPVIRLSRSLRIRQLYRGRDFQSFYLPTGQLVDHERSRHGGERAGLEFGLQRLVVLVAESAAALGVAAR